MAENAKKVELSVADRRSVWLRSTFLQGSWNYERMQNGGWCYAMIPAIKKLYTTKDEQSAALKRHLEFFGMMGPLAGVGDPVFWFTLRPILAALGASLALSQNLLGPVLFFVLWNVARMAFMWYTQEFGYRVGTAITKDLSGGLLGKVTKGASILGMFILGALVMRWVSINFVIKVSEVQRSAGAYIDWANLPEGSEGIHQAISQFAAGLSLEPTVVTTLQDNLNSLIPGLVPLLLTLGCMRLLKKNVSPIVIILALFVIGILGHIIGLL